MISGIEGGGVGREKRPEAVLAKVRARFSIRATGRSEAGSELLPDGGRIEEVVVFSGDEKREDEVAEVFARTVFAVELDQRADLFLRTVCHDTGEFSFQEGVAGNHAEIRGAWKIAIGGELVEFRDFLERFSEFGPNGALCVKCADGQFAMDDLVIRMDIGTGRHEDAGRANMPEEPDEGIGETGRACDSGRAWDCGVVSGVVFEAAIVVVQEEEAIFRKA